MPTCRESWIAQGRTFLGPRSGVQLSRWSRSRNPWHWEVLHTARKRHSPGWTCLRWRWPGWSREGASLTSAWTLFGDLGPASVGTCWGCCCGAEAGREADPRFPSQPPMQRWRRWKRTRNCLNTAFWAVVSNCRRWTVVDDDEGVWVRRMRWWQAGWWWTRLDWKPRSNSPRMEFRGAPSHWSLLLWLFRFLQEK